MCFHGQFERDVVVLVLFHGDPFIIDMHFKLSIGYVFVSACLN